MVAMFNGQPIFGPRGPAGPDGNPIGTVISYMGTTAPEDYLVCDGAEYEIAQYSELAKFFETQFGTSNHFGGDGSITFAVPDLRNLFLRGFHGDADEQLSGEIGERQDGTEIPSVYGINAPSGGIGAAQSNPLIPTHPRKVDTNINLTKNYSTVSQSYVADVNSSNSWISEYYTSRPVNSAVLYCIKAVTSSGTENVYSTEEQIVGRWIDGKPVYRLCFTMISNSQTNTITSYNLSQYHIKYVCSLRGILYSSEYYVTVPYIFDNQQINLIYHETDGCVYEKHNNDGHSSSPMTVVIEYTKTTD